MKYIQGMMGYPISQHVPVETEKAWGFTERRGYTTIKDQTRWIPKSVLKIGEPNGNGWVEVMIPLWFVARNRWAEGLIEIQYKGVIDIKEERQ